MNDRELLELSAKASGIAIEYAPAGTENIDGSLKKFRVISWHGPFLEGTDTGWNPLEDDGDALRLAVKLKLVPYPPDKSDNRAVCRDYDCIYVDEPPSGDPYAATRRVIVRAAAEIGKSIKNTKD